MALQNVACYPTTRRHIPEHSVSSSPVRNAVRTSGIMILFSAAKQYELYIFRIPGVTSVDT